MAIAVGILALVLLFAAATLKVSVQPALLISDEKGQSLAKIPLENGTFVHRFIHSIHRTAVDEEFHVTGRLLVLSGLRYDSYGVGMPTDGGESFRIEDNRFVIDLHREFDRLDIRVSHLPGHGIEANGQFYPFTAWVALESLVTLKPGRIYSLSFRRKLSYERSTTK